MRLTKNKLVQIIKEELVDLSKDSHSMPSKNNISPEKRETLEILSDWLGRIRGLHIWFHGAHHATAGKTFAGDHSQLYERIYTEIQSEYDADAEKCAGILDDSQVTCPIKVTEHALHFLMLYPSPVTLDADSLASVALQIVKDHVLYVEELFDALEKSGNLTLGFNDLLASQANSFETYVYLLQQRTALVN